MARRSGGTHIRGHRPGAPRCDLGAVPDMDGSDTCAAMDSLAELMSWRPHGLTLCRSVWVTFRESLSGASG
ncbi:hypothetical protein IE4872_CH00682 [Rhizobium gallicum]|uniref:Uncharacterized protein n=1 Tax=Rhizobium gallicum TaxID=56730 RepID=A0A1L5NEM6_9HYPH|nr:hypothetical protein IE4872_CH00682 [Rhizobium gallicum]